MQGAAPSGVGRRALPQFGQYVLVGLSGVVVNLIVFALVLAAFTGHAVFDLVGSLTHASSSTTASAGQILFASTVAFAVATLWNYALNNAWTFRRRHARRHSSRRRLALYYLVSLASLAINEAVLYALIAFVPPLYGQAAGIVAGSVVGFLGNRRFTFAEVSAGPIGPAGVPEKPN
jgi:putative flippase GtrA